MIGIYKITNPNGKIYVGQSINIKKRFTDYKYPKKNQTKIYYSIEKYGYLNHTFEVIEECETEILNERERYWQDYYDVLNKGLNCRLTETNDKTGFFSEESKLKISASKKGITPICKDPEKRSKNISAALTGKKLTIEHRLSLSKAQTGLKRSPESIKKSSDSRRGMKYSDDFKENIRKRQTGGGNSMAKLVLNTETGIFYTSLKEAAESIGFTANRMNHYMNGRTKTKLPFIYV